MARNLARSKALLYERTVTFCKKRIPIIITVSYRVNFFSQISPSSISTPFSYLLPFLEIDVTSNIDILLAPLSYRPQISICHPFPPFIFIPIPIFLSFLLVRKFSYCFLFPLFLTYFFLFYLILSPAYFFVPFFPFPCSRAK